MMGAGRLDRRYQFQMRQEVEDGHGNSESEWVSVFEATGNRLLLRGGETVLASRLTGRTPMVLTVRNSESARRIAADWRVTDMRTGQLMAVREDPRESDNRAYLEMLVESGVAA